MIEDKPIEKDCIHCNITVISAEDLYDVLCKEFDFNRMIDLYKLIKHKMEYLDDMPRMTVSCRDRS